MWGWGTSDSEQALAMLRRFGSVTVLNGHIHQVMQKVEGQRHVPHGDVDGVSAACARHRAVTGPMKVPAEKLRDVLGITHVQFVPRSRSLATVDATLSGSPIATGDSKQEAE